MTQLSRAASPRYLDALTLMYELHRDQLRKGTRIPYISHLLTVSAQVMEYGGDEDEAIAGLLHDAVEDCGGQPTLDLIRDRFGDRVAEIVAGCTDADCLPKPPWSERKQAYIRDLADAGPSVRLVSCSDKVHNARAILLDVRDHGESVWLRFRPGKAGTLWYYRALADVFAGAGPERPAAHLNELVSAMEREFNGGEPVRRLPDSAQGHEHAA